MKTATAPTSGITPSSRDAASDAMPIDEYQSTDEQSGPSIRGSIMPRPRRGPGPPPSPLRSSSTSTLPVSSWYRMCCLTPHPGSITRIRTHTGCFSWQPAASPALTMCRTLSVPWQPKWPRSCRTSSLTISFGPGRRVAVGGRSVVLEPRVGVGGAAEWGEHGHSFCLVGTLREHL